MAGAVRTVYAYSLAFNPVKAKFGREECGMKLLGVAELADGSLNFAFGVAPEGSSSSGNILDTTMAGEPQLASSQLPVRFPSAFQKKSPISISTRRRQQPGRSREPVTKEAELPKQSAVAEDVLSSDRKNESVLVPERIKKGTLRSSEEAVSSQTTSSPKIPGHTLPRRMKSKFVKQSPVPFSNEAIHATADVSSKSNAANAGAKTTSRKVSSQVTTSEMSVVARVDGAVGISVQTGSVIAETLREHAAGDTHTSAKPTEVAVSEGSDTNNAAIAGDSQEFAALTIQGLSASISSQESAEKEGEKDLGTEAASGEGLSAYKLADLKSMAKSRGLKGYSKLKKADLIELLSKQDA